MRDLVGRVNIMLADGDGPAWMANTVGEYSIAELELNHKNIFLRRALLCRRGFIQAHTISPAASLPRFEAVAMGPEIHAGYAAKDAPAGALNARGVLYV